MRSAWSGGPVLSAVCLFVLPERYGSPGSLTAPILRSVRCARPARSAGRALRLEGRPVSRVGGAAGVSDPVPEMQPARPTSGTFSADGRPPPSPPSPPHSSDQTSAASSAFLSWTAYKIGSNGLPFLGCFCIFVYYMVKLLIYANAIHLAIYLRSKN